MTAPYQNLALDMAAQSRSIRLRVTGNSMAPILVDGDSVILRPASLDRIRIGELIAFRQGAETLTHRLLSVSSQSFITMGDNQSSFDLPSAPELLLGHIIAIEKKGHQINISGGVWVGIQRILAWLGWQSYKPNQPRWAVFIPRAFFGLFRYGTLLLLK